MTPPMIDAYLDELLGDAALLAPADALAAAPVAEAARDAVAAAAATGPDLAAPERSVHGDPVHGAIALSTEAGPAPAMEHAPPVQVVAPVAPVLQPAALEAAPALRTVAAPQAADPAPRTAARATSPSRGAPPGRWLRVCIGDDRYAVELLRVQEVVRVAPVVAMRGAEPWVLGVMNLRGRIVPVIDLGVWLDAGQVIPEERSRIVVVERNDELIGLLVTAVNDVATLDASHIEPPLTAGDRGPIVGVARAGDAPTVLLDANALFE